MATFIKARSILACAPKEALSDAIGFGMVAIMLFAGFLVPAFL